MCLQYEALCPYHRWQIECICAAPFQSCLTSLTFQVSIHPLTYSYSHIHSSPDTNSQVPTCSSRVEWHSKRLGESMFFSQGHKSNLSQWPSYDWSDHLSHKHNINGIWVFVDASGTLTFKGLIRSRLLRLFLTCLEMAAHKFGYSSSISELPSNFPNVFFFFVLPFLTGNSTLEFKYICRTTTPAPKWLK